MTPSVDLAELKIIFVVGSVRSGTSIVGQALDHVFGGGKGYFEGSVIGLTTALTDAVDGYYGYFPEDYLQSGAGNHISEVPKEWLKTTLQQQIINEAIKPILLNGASATWVDKSPDGHFQAENVRACAALAKMFPKAKFVFCRRHGVENIASRMRKWPESSFINQCYGWAGVMEAWAKVRPALAGRSVEVDQHAIATEPARVADEVAACLGATQEERNRLFTFLTEENPEQTGGGHDRPPRTIAEIDWDVMKKWIFLAICGPAMSRYKYEVGEAPAVHAGAPILSIDDPKIPIEWINTSYAPWTVMKLPGGFQLHPVGNARPAPTLIFRAVPAWAEMRLRGALVHGTRRGAGVTFKIRVSEPDGGRTIFEQRFVVAPGEAFELDEPFYSSTDLVDVEVSSSLSPWRRGADFAWGRAIGLSCTPDPRVR